MDIITDAKKIDEILERGTIVQILPTKDEFRKKLLNGERLKFYIGFDATAPTLHLSHAKNLMLLEKFRKLGHEVIVLFGDFTARIGDPTGEKSSRKQLTRDDVLENVKIWKELIKPLMDFNDKENPPVIKYNNEWLSKLNFEDIINLSSNFTVQQMIERDMFDKRLKDGKPIYLHEFFYPLMQGYDSVVMDVDVELCGTDQIFNALAGRTLLRKLKDKEKIVVAVTLMENPKTGELMSKSKGTGVFLDVSASDMYGQVMSQPDEMMEILFVNVTDLPLDEIKNLVKGSNPMEVKKRLAFEIVKKMKGEEKAKEAEENFKTQFQKGGIPENIEEFEVKVGEGILAVLNQIDFVSSNGEARRKVVEKAVKLDGETIEDPTYTLGAGEKIIKLGRKIAKLIIK
ncbi:tyrosine--tRNA ligase [Candidatus Campbellbacteria bacterium RIFOXYC2_FULL_35_25]|uniref:Tyrosine--tRNA ligase n=1 Tax=Candidatus Campbellbacteria bacterium RIFOXYC2_FULL_35_25 TaxID=1797582 RepID=A0A1F5EJB6_9BACT|nr:MAG: tyrosine--tRNA ligase [Candidatus Campbellbacteria bacterium RIFOXYC2_FULL_35_25]